MAGTKKSKTADLPRTPSPAVTAAVIQLELDKLRKRKYGVPPLAWAVDIKGLVFTSNTVAGHGYKVDRPDDRATWSLRQMPTGFHVASGPLADMLARAEIDLHGKLLSQFTIVW